MTTVQTDQDAKFTPKYSQVRDALLADIRNGRLKPGDKLPVREELIVKYSAARNTIDRALNELIEDGVLWASRRKGTYVAELAQTRKVAIISWRNSLQMHAYDFGNRHSFFDLFGQLMKRLTGQKYDIISPEDASGNPELLDDFDCVLWNNAPQEALQKCILRPGVREKIFLLNRYYPGYRFVSTDHRAACRDVTRLLLAHTPADSQVYYLSLPNDYVSNERFLGFMDACGERQKFYRVCELDASDHERNLEALRKLELLSGKPVVVVSPTCVVSGVMLRVAAERGFSLHRDFFYSDFDNAQPMRDTGYRIPSVLQDYQAMADRAFELLSASEAAVYVPHLIANNPFADANGNGE